MRPLGSAVWLALVFAVLAAPSARAALLFHETFADNSAGWTLGAEWQIGPTFAGTGHGAGWPDPEFDRSPGSDNGVAGAVIGGTVENVAHGVRWIESPVIDLSAVAGSVTLSWWLWENTRGPFIDHLEAFDGVQWQTVYRNPYLTFDSAWHPYVVDVTAYKNAAFRLRFGHSRGDGYSPDVAGMNVDEVALWSGCRDVDGDGAEAVECGGTDCNDFDETIHPGATETCNALDDDCDGLVDEGLPQFALFPDYDMDGFGYGPGRILVCDAALYPGYVTDSTDCVDGDAQIHPGAVEICNGFDDDCDGMYDEGCSYGQILSITDVGNDQGRRVRLRWFRDAFDRGAGFRYVTRYLVFRRVTAGQAPALAARPEFALPPGDWDFVAEVPPLREDFYSVIVPTLCDSNAAGGCPSVFIVRAMYSDGPFADSPPDSGSSVDNLAPSVPQNLSLAPSGGGLMLTWAESLDPDFQYFEVHRGADPGFVPSASTREHATTGTSWTDLSAQGSVWYKLVAVDFNGNASAPAMAHTTLGVEGAVPVVLSFASLAPSPFSSAVSIAFDVPAGGGTLRLEVLDLAGRRVRTLSSGALAGGRHVARWEGAADAGGRVAPGVYHLRLTDGSRVMTSRVVLSP